MRISDWSSDVCSSDPFFSLENWRKRWMHPCVRCVSKMSARCVASQPRDLATMWVGSGMIRALRLPSGDGVLPLVLGHPIRDHGLGFTVGHIPIELDRDKQTATKHMVGNPRPNAKHDSRPPTTLNRARIERSTGRS